MAKALRWLRNYLANLAVGAAITLIFFAIIALGTALLFGAYELAKVVLAFDAKAIAGGAAVVIALVFVFVLLPMSGADFRRHR